MTPIIHRLPEALANQIAAGEVVQRPSSVVKELMENALDAGATQVRVFIRDGGKTLIQVLDNGKGMGQEDALLCFERHATSKISSIEDLFSIRTMGFRGEALAAIASVAKVELKTRTADEEIGRRVVVDASRLVSNEPCQTPVGTVVSVHHLFYNVPASRNFLRAGPVEMRRIVDEFQRVALANPDIEFSLEHNGIELFHVKEANARQRVVAILGKAVNERLVPVSEQTPLLSIEGFVGKPAAARKVRGEQYFFLNGRFFRNAYLQHAVMACYEKLIPEKHYPLYVLFLEMDPAQVDVNVHPTKEEIRFEDDKAIYALLGAAVRHALSRFSATPTLDFDVDPDMADLEAFRRPLRSGGDTGGYQIGQPGRTPSYPRPSAPMGRNASGAQPWEALFEIAAKERAGDAESERFPDRDTATADPDGIAGGPASPFDLNQSHTLTVASEMEEGLLDPTLSEPTQWHGRYILCPIKSGMLVLDQRAAHERVLYEKYLQRLEQGAGSSQQQLFPVTVELSPSDAQMLRELLPAVNALGFDIQPFGPHAFVVHGFPADCREMDEQLAVDELLESFRSLGEVSGLKPRERVARSLARAYAIPAGRKLATDEMRGLIDELFACKVPYAAPDGNLTFFTLGLDEIAARFRKRT